MTLTVVIGSSGSGKTTFLNDTTKSHKCTYIRQYHNIRPYIKVSKIPNFDPTKLPFWDTYVAEGTADTIMAGGTMAGQFTAGLSGGQRKVLLFELICQRTTAQSNLLLVLDEPFAGVTDDFVPYIVGRLHELQKQHNVLLVTNDHVDTLKKMADNTIVVSAVDRTTVQVNGLTKVDREKAILALSVGGDFVYKSTLADLKFFVDVELVNSGAILGVAIFTVIAYALFVATFWDSGSDAAALVIVAASLVAIFCVNPYLVALSDWRNFMQEEAEALVHSSVGVNNALKSLLTLALIIIVSFIEWGLVIAVSTEFESIRFWWAIFMDSASMTFPFIFFGIYTKLPFQATQIFSTMPFLFMIFFSTTFSPGSGVPVLKELRYLFARFYLWCMIPGVQDDMEGCPDSDVNMVYLTLSGLLGLILFLFYQAVKSVKATSHKEKSIAKKNLLKVDAEFKDLQLELYGEVMISDSISNTSHSAGNNSSQSKGKSLFQDETPYKECNA